MLLSGVRTPAVYQRSRSDRNNRAGHAGHKHTNTMNLKEQLWCMCLGVSGRFLLVSNGSDSLTKWNIMLHSESAGDNSENRLLFYWKVKQYTPFDFLMKQEKMGHAEETWAVWLVNNGWGDRKMSARQRLMCKPWAGLIFMAVLLWLR